MSNSINNDGISAGPLPASSKVYVHGHGRPDVQVPMRAIQLTGGHAGNGHGNGAETRLPLMVYDTSGPYTDPTVGTDIRKGLAPLRLAWIKARGDVE